MDLRYVSDGFHLDRKDLFGREAPVPSWLSADSLPLFPIDTGDNSAGNGGNGYFAGSLIDSSYAAFEPLNMAQAGAHATAGAHQTNVGFFDQRRPRRREPAVTAATGMPQQAAVPACSDRSAPTPSRLETTAPAMAATATSRERWCMHLSRSLIPSTSPWRAFMAPRTPTSRIRFSSFRALSRLAAAAVTAATAMRRLAAARLSLVGVVARSPTPSSHPTTAASVPTPSSAGITRRQWRRWIFLWQPRSHVLRAVRPDQHRGGRIQFQRPCRSIE